MGNKSSNPQNIIQLKLPSLTRKELWRQAVQSERGFSSTPGGSLNYDPKEKGWGLGKGYETFAAIQIIDKDGNQVHVGIGAYLGGHKKEKHAERESIRALRAQLPSKVLGGQMMVVVDQDPCPACTLELDKLAKDLGLSQLDVSVPERQSLRGSKKVSPKTASRTSTKGNVPELHLKPVLLRKYELNQKTPVIIKKDDGGIRSIVLSKREKPRIKSLILRKEETNVRGTDHRSTGSNGVTTPVNPRSRMRRAVKPGAELVGDFARVVHNFSLKSLKETLLEKEKPRIREKQLQRPEEGVLVVIRYIVDTPTQLFTLGEHNSIQVPLTLHLGGKTKKESIEQFLSVPRYTKDTKGWKLKHTEYVWYPPSSLIE